MQVQLEQILALQPRYSARNTPEMQERGRLVRTVAAEWIHGHASALAADMRIPVDELLVEGRDGTGLKSRVPWLRFAWNRFSKERNRGLLRGVPI